MRELLEVEDFWCKEVLNMINFLYCNFIIVKQSQGYLNPQDGLIYSYYCIYRG
jgi:hypothetical protein